MEKSEKQDSQQKPQYVRQQKGHSVVFAIFIAGPLTFYILPIYWAVSPNHFYHF